MKRTKLMTGLMTATSIGLILIFISTTVLAATTVGPISNFTDTNNNIAAWADPESELIIFPHGWFVYGFPDAPQSIADCEPSGSVQEKDLKDGRIMYKVDLHVKGAVMVVGAYLSGEILLVGEMDYHFQITMIAFDAGMGDPVPNILQIWFPEFFLPPGSEPIGEGIFTHLTGQGTGTFLDANMALYYGFDPDEEVKVTVNQVGILKPIDHPTYDGEDLLHYPVEIVFFH